MRSHIVEGEQTACEFRTAHPVTLWPLEIEKADYFSSAGAVAGLGITKVPGVNACLRVRLHCPTGLKLGELPVETLPFFLMGDDTAVQLYEQILGNLVGIVAQPTSRPFRWAPGNLPRSSARRAGFGVEEAMLPYSGRSFQGYRLLHEYFAFPQRFLFVEITNMRTALGGCPDDALDLVFLFDRSRPELSDAVASYNLNLFCTPAINLFPKRLDRMHLTNRTVEHHIVPDRTRTVDYEVYGITQVQGFGDRSEPEVDFLPFYAVSDRNRGQESRAFYTVFRQPRKLSATQLRGNRSSYVGSEVFVSLVDSAESPYTSGLKQLGVEALCTNRHLPLRMPVGTQSSDFTLQSGAPYESIRCLVGPTTPRPSRAHREIAWELISHLALNYLSLTDNDAEKGAMALRQILALYGDNSDLNVQRQVEGVLSIESNPIVRRIEQTGRINTLVPVIFGRGLEIKVLFDEASFKGSGVFLLGAVLEQFFARYVSTNSFTETVMETTERGEIMRWPVQIGKRHLV